MQVRSGQSVCLLQLGYQCNERIVFALVRPSKVDMNCSLSWLDSFTLLCVFHAIDPFETKDPCDLCEQLKFHLASRSRF